MILMLYHTYQFRIGGNVEMWERTHFSDTNIYTFAHITIVRIFFIADFISYIYPVYSSVLNLFERFESSNM